MSEKEVNRFQPLGKTKLVKGSILTPENAGLRFVLSVNNTAGKSENPLFPLFDKKWKQVKSESKGWYNTRTGAYKLGAVRELAVQSDVWVINMLCQNDNIVTDVKALEDCLKKVCAMAKYERATIHVSTLLTDAIPELQGLLGEQLVKNGVSVYYYQEV